MAIVKIYGGLGNQMFQYAFGQHLKQKYGIEVFYDTLDFDFYKLRNFELSKFNVSINQADAKLSNKFRYSKSPRLNFIINKYILLNQNYFYEPNINISNLTSIESGYFWGYWQLKDSYNNIIDILRNEFEYNSPFSNYAQQYLENIESCNSVSIHIRKSDYLLQKNNYFANCSSRYYLEAIDIINSKVKNPKYFIFTDDLEWVKNNIDFKHINHTFITTHSNNSTVEDWCLMKKCKYQIIANSTYSWWAAYLNNYKFKLVLCPKKWFTNSENTLNLDSWLEIDNNS